MNRRQFVASSTVVVGGGIAGCLGSSWRGNVFESVGANGLELDVELNGEAGIRELTLTKDGEYIVDTSLRAGEYATTMPLLDYGGPRGELDWMYPRGDLILVGVDDDGEEYDHDLTLMPDSDIVDVSVTGDSNSRPEIIVENTGSGPDAVHNIGVASDAPVESYAFRDDSSVTWSDGTSSHVPLGVGESVEIRPPDHVFRFAVLPEAVTSTPEPDEFEDKDALREEWGDEIAEVEVGVETAEQLLVAEIDVRFGGEIERIGPSPMNRGTYFTESEVEEFSTSVSDW